MELRYIILHDQSKKPYYYIIVDETADMYTVKDIFGATVETKKHGYHEGQQVVLDKQVVTIIGVRKHSLMIVDSNNMCYFVDFSAVQPITY